MGNQNGNAPISAASLTDRLNAYLRKCAEAEGGGRFPNLAGFCRFCGMGESGLAAMAEKYPAEYDFIISTLEDEALNSAKTATLIAAYLKCRFGYGARVSQKPDDRRITLHFEHDILEDGG